MIEETKNNIKNINKKLKEEERKVILEKTIINRKMEIIKPNLCKSYIKYNKPNLEELIKLFEEEQNKRDIRLSKLIKKLKECNINFDNKIPVFNKYIKEGGDLETTIKEAKLEKSLIYNTKYEHYLKYNTVQVARYLATIEYNNKNSDKIECDEVKKFASNNNTLFFN